MHALARDLFYGNRGRINARDLWEQMNSCSCLTLIVACIIYWQAKDISRVIRTADPERHGIELSLLRHVSPIEWDNIVLYVSMSSIADSSGGRAHGLSVQNRTDLPDTLGRAERFPSGPQPVVVSWGF